MAETDIQFYFSFHPPSQILVLAPYWSFWFRGASHQAITWPRQRQKKRCIFV